MQFVVQIATIPMSLADVDPGKPMSVFIRAPDEKAARKAGAEALSHPEHDLTVTRYEQP